MVFQIFDSFLKEYLRYLKRLVPEKTDECIVFDRMICFNIIWYLSIYNIYFMYSCVFENMKF